MNLKLDQFVAWSSVTKLQVEEATGPASNNPGQIYYKMAESILKWFRWVRYVSLHTKKELGYPSSPLSRGNVVVL